MLPLPGAFSTATAVAALLQSQAARGAHRSVAMLCAAAVKLQRAAYEVVGTLAQRSCKRKSLAQEQVVSNMNRHTYGHSCERQH